MQFAPIQAGRAHFSNRCKCGTGGGAWLAGWLLAGLRERSFQFLFLNGQKTHRIRFFLLVLTLRSRLLGREKRPEI